MFDFLTVGSSATPAKTNRKYAAMPRPTAPTSAAAIATAGGTFTAATTNALNATKFESADNSIMQWLAFK
jgi:hypothetical protein